MTRFATVAVAALVLVLAVSLTRREGAPSPRGRGAALETSAVVLPVALPAATSASADPVAPTTATQGPCDGVREALASADGARIDESLDRLIGWVSGDVRRALEVVALMTRETDPMLLDMVADALSQDPGIGDAREVVEAFHDMALRDVLPARRIAALTFLQERPRDASLTATFLSIASRDADPDVRVAAVCAIRRQVDLVPARRAALNEMLLRVAASGEAGVRAAAVQALSLSDADDLQISSVIGFLRDADPMVRATAAEKLGEGGYDRRAAVLRALEETYMREGDERVRPLVLAALVRSGGAEAVPALRRMAGAHPSLDPVVTRLTASLSSAGADTDAVLDEVFGQE